MVLYGINTEKPPLYRPAVVRWTEKDRRLDCRLYRWLRSHSELEDQLVNESET